MKTCSNCNAQLDEQAIFCANCGTKCDGEQTYTVPQPGYAPMYDPYDHTAEFDAKDISDNKVISMLVYLAGAVGIIIALLVSNTSKYVAFHVRQALKFTVVEILALLCTALLFWTVLVPVVCGVFVLALTVIKLICFFQVCAGKAKEPAIIRDFAFLR